MATRIESSEFKTVRGKFVAICDCISEPDVVKYAGELLQSNLISDAGHQAAIAVTGLPPVVRLLSAVFYDYRDRMDKSIKFCMDMLQDLLINIRRGATKKRIHSKS